MIYEEVVKKAKQAVKKLDAEKIREHIALQFDIEGEGEGAFYVEASQGKISVEPYEYFDRDCKIRAGADTVIALLSGKKEAQEALAAGQIVAEGNLEKALSLVKAVKAAPKKAAAAKEKAVTPKEKVAAPKEKAAAPKEKAAPKAKSPKK